MAHVAPRCRVRSLAVCLLALTALAPRAGALVLYGARGSGPNSDLVVIDPTSGMVEKTIGPIGHSVTGLAVEPATGALYGTTSSKSALPGQLLSIDVATGTGTPIGPDNLGSKAVADISFAPDGTLFGWKEGFVGMADDLVTLDLATGAGAFVGDAGLETAGTGLAFAPNGVLFLLFADGSAGLQGVLHRVDTSSGATTFVEDTTLSGSLFGSLAIDPQTGVGYTAIKGALGGAATLQTIDLATAHLTPIGATLGALDALAFGPECGDGFLSPNEQCDDGNTADHDGCSSECQATSCSPAPDPSCLAATHASLMVVERKMGSEKLKATLAGFAADTTQASFGDPVGGATVYELCLYDASDTSIGRLVVDAAGDTCGSKGKGCWSPQSGKGWKYKDADALRDGVRSIKATSGSAGKGKLQVQAGNRASKGQSEMPIGLTAALAGKASATVQIATSDAACFEASLAVKKSDAVLWKGKTP